MSRQTDVNAWVTAVLANKADASWSVTNVSYYISADLAQDVPNVNGKATIVDSTLRGRTIEMRSTALLKNGAVTILLASQKLAIMEGV